jgi:hypothetical protein
MRPTDKIIAEQAARQHRQKAARDAQYEAVRCPVAERIVDNNKPPQYGHGMRGATELFGRFHQPQMYKRQAAVAIIALRKNRVALKHLGKPANAGFEKWFGRAQHNRRMAQKLSKTGGNE